MEKVTFFTLATKKERGFPQYLASCDKNGINPVVLGLGQRWEGFTQKIRLVREKLNSLDHDSFAVVTDCYDLVFQKGPEELVRVFTAYNKSIVFSAERGIGFPIRCVHLPATPNPLYRGLCAGFWMARVGMAVRVIDEGWGNTLCNSSIDDQGALQGWFIKNVAKGTVDYLNNLVCTTEPGYIQQDLEYRDGVIYNRHTGTAPCAIHGAARTDMRMIYETLGL